MKNIHPRQNLKGWNASESDLNYSFEPETD